MASQSDWTWDLPRDQDDTQPMIDDNIAVNNTNNSLERYVTKQDRTKNNEFCLGI